MPKTTQALKRLPWLLVLLVALSFTSSCVVVQRVQEFRADRQVPKAMSTLWQVYQTIKADYGGKEHADDHALAQGAVHGMVTALAETDTSFLTDTAYHLDTPNFEGVWQAWSIIADHLKATASPVTSAQVQEGAIRGMVQALGNPYTTYLDPSGYTLQEQDLHSNFNGIGAYVDMQNNQLTIVGVMTDTPAAKAGIKEGDVILEADGKSLQGLSVTEAVLLIRGPKGTPVALTVQSSGDAAPRTITVVRDTVQQPSVIWKGITKEVALLQITEFLDYTDQQVKEALVQIQAQGYKGIVLDLRNNPGGLLNVTVNIASQFLKDGLVLYSIDAKGKRQDYPVKSGGVALDLPLVILGNGGSASGSEVLTGALQDHQRAKLVGTQTYGKGSVNELLKMGDGSGLYITAALWYTPNGRLIEGEGLKPDIQVLNERIVSQQNGHPLVTIVDHQLDQAMALVQAAIAAQSALATA